MSKYLFTGKYTATGVKGLIQEGGSSRHQAVKSAVESVGGKLESFHFAYGETDIFAIVDFPDSAGAISLALLIGSTGVVSLSTVPLITVDEMDAAAKKSPSYRAPKG